MRKFVPFSHRDYKLCMGPVVLLLCLSWLMCFVIIPSSGADSRDGDYVASIWEKEKKDGHIDFWSIEERYEHEQQWVDYLLTRDGDPYMDSLNGLPDDDDIKQDAARELSIKAVKEKFGNKAFEDGREWIGESVYFLDYFTGAHEWRFCFYSKPSGSKSEPIPYYEAWIDAKTGEVNKVYTHDEIISLNPDR